MGVMGILTSVAVLALQVANPPVSDPESTRAPNGPLDRKPNEPVSSPAPVPAGPAGARGSGGLRGEAESVARMPGVRPGERTQPPAAPANVEVPGTVRVRSELGKRFKLVESVILLDGVTVAQRRADQGHELEREFDAFNGLVTPGAHAMTVTLVYEGRNPGLFSYVDNYRMRVVSSYAFEAAADRPAALEVVARERKDGNLPLDKRPFLEVVPASGSGATPLADTAAAPAAR